MSQRKISAELRDTFTESEVADYLGKHPEFFERHTRLLLKLRLPHETQASAVSLVERQVTLLRKGHADLDRQLKDLVAVAKRNDALVEKIHHLSIRLLADPSCAGRLAQLERSLREDFSAERAALVLLDDAMAGQQIEAGFALRYKRQDAALKPFAAFLRAARPRCGTLRDRQRSLLFGEDGDTIASAAMVPLGAEASLGFLVIGSRDPHHFHPGMRMDFLGRLGELVAVAVESGRA